MGDVCIGRVSDVVTVDRHKSEGFFSRQKDILLPVLPTRSLNIHRHYSRVTEARIRVDRLAAIPGQASTYK